MNLPKLAFAADFSSLKEAKNFIKPIEELIDVVKIGSELFASEGPKALQCTTKPIMLDLKLHDIPETVERTIKVIGNLGVKYCTLHVQQKEAMMRAAEMARQFDLKLLAVTVLTSMSETEADELYGKSSILELMYNRVSKTISSKIKGIVCSSEEVSFIREEFGKSLFLAVPGIKFNNSKNDQKRTSSLQLAAQADMVIVGRAIRDSKNPIKMINSIRQKING